MINHNSIFRDQLKKIGSAINKKHTILRKQILKTLQVFENNQLPIFPYQVCFGLFKHIIQTGSLTASLIFFPFIQNIINLGFATQQMSKQIINLLTHVKSIPKFHNPQNSSKLQTIIMLLVGKHAVNLTNMTYTHSIVNILFSLENNKNKNLWMKTISTLNQIVLLFINQLKEENIGNYIQEKMEQEQNNINTNNNINNNNSINNNNKKSQKSIIFSTFLSDMVNISKSQQPKWLKQVPQAFISLSLISDILQQKYIKQHSIQLSGSFTNFMSYLRKTISKISLSKITSQNTSHHHKDSPQKHQKHYWQLTQQNQLIILMRVACKLSKLYNMHFDILQQLIKIVSEKGHSSIKFIGYQSINYMFNSNYWMQTMLNSTSGDLFNFLLTTLFNNAKYILSQYKDKIDLNVEYQIEKGGKLFNGNFVDFTSFELIPVIQLKMIIKNIQQISFTFYSIYQQIYKIKMEKSIPPEQTIPLQKTYKFCQKTVFQISKALIPKQMPEDVLQSLLKICQKFINLSGVFNDNNTSTMYIKLICKYCLPSQFKNIGHRHVQINKIILNIANCLGSILFYYFLKNYLDLFSTSCWAIVWKALENYSVYYNRYLLGKEQLQLERKNDVEILYKSMESIFTESSKYENLYLLKILRSLIEVTYQCLENNFTDENKKIFAFQRIEQIYKLNLFRIPIIWPQLSSSLLCITTSKSPNFRLSALNLLNSLIPISLHYLKTHPQMTSQKMTKQTRQTIILQPWVNLSSCHFPEIKSQLSISVNKLIIDYGHIMQNGWYSILQIVKKTKDIKSLQAIVQTYLDKIKDNIMMTINIIDQVERSLNDMNQKYLCLTLIWAIGDHCHRNNQNQALRRIYQMLLQPEEMFILGMEARHSSFYIFAEIIVHNCSEKEELFWKWIFEEITKYYTFAMKKCLQRKQNCEDQLKNILSNLIKIYRRLFSVAKQFKTDQLILNQLNKFFKLAADMLQFRNSQIYQMVLKQSKQILLLKTTQSLVCLQFWKFLQSLNQIYFIQSDNKILKCLITYLPPDIYQIISKTLPYLQEKFQVIYHLIQKIFLLRLQAEQKDIKLNQLRIFFDDKIFMELLKKMHYQIIKIDGNTQKNTQQLFVNLYIENLIKTNHKLILYEDYNFLQKLIHYSIGLLEKYSKFIDYKDGLQILKKIVYLKYDQSWIKSYVNSKQVPVWYIATQQLIKLGFLYNQLKTPSPYNKIYSIFSIMINKNQPQFKQNCLMSSYTQSYSLPLFYENYLQILNFLAECYFSNDQFQIQQKQIQLICKNIANEASYDEKDKTKKAKNSYDLLFKLAMKRKQDIKQIENNKIIKRQTIFIKYLFQRIINSFKDYFTIIDSKQTGQSLQKVQIQLKFILKKLLSFQLKQNILQTQSLKQFLLSNSLIKINLQSSVLKNSISHLFYFYSFISKCIKSNNEEIRQVICQIMEKVGGLILAMQ